MECIHCLSDHTQKNGQLKGGGQRFRCVDCKKSFTKGGSRGTYSEEFKDKIVDEYCHQKTSARKLSKEFNLSTSTLVQWGKQHKEDCDKCC